MAAQSAEDKRISTIVKRLGKQYPQADCHLNYSNAFQLLIATILAAQCTDARVNEVTPDLFKKYRTPKAFAEAKEEDLQEAIRSTGFFRNKAKSIKNASKELVEKHKGQVPETMEELSSLPGVGRKTANVILGNVYDKPAIIVDTHVQRVSQRLGMTSEKDATKIEKDLREKVPESKWTAFSHQLGEHGRRVCIAKKPKCKECFLNDICPFYDPSVLE